MIRKHKISVFLLGLCSVLMSQASDTTYYSLQACRDLALTKGASAQSHEETRLAAEYNRKAALAAMFPRVSANGGYMWNSRNAHLLANQTQFSFGTASVAPDGTASFTWSGESKIGKLAAEFEGTRLEQPILDIETDAGQKMTNLGVDYQNALASARADAENKKAAALIADQNNQNNWYDNQAKLMAGYGDFSAYERLYGKDAAQQMRDVWIVQNPEAALGAGLIDQARYKQITGK
jgi:hypothetical protein